MGLFGKKEKETIKEELKELICPYCNVKITDETGIAKIYVSDVDVALVGCPHCKKVLGGSLNF